LSEEEKVLQRRGPPFRLTGPPAAREEPGDLDLVGRSADGVADEGALAVASGSAAEARRSQTQSASKPRSVSKPTGCAAPDPSRMHARTPSAHARSPLAAHASAMRSPQQPTIAGAAT